MIIAEDDWHVDNEDHQCATFINAYLQPVFFLNGKFAIGFCFKSKHLTHQASSINKKMSIYYISMHFFLFTYDIKVEKNKYCWLITNFE